MSYYRGLKEKKRARDAKQKEAAEEDHMLAMYNQHVLGVKPTPGIVPLSATAPAAPKPAATQKEVGSFGDSFFDLVQAQGCSRCGQPFSFGGADRDSGLRIGRYLTYNISAFLDRMDETAVRVRMTKERI